MALVTPVLVVTSKEDKLKIALGADHGGFELKEVLKAYITQELKYEVLDLGCHSKAAVDYPDFAFMVACAVSERRCDVGIMVDGAGIGSSMVANKVPNVRAAFCHDLYSVKNSREHNHANVLTLGGQTLGPGHAKVLVKTWLETPWGPDRHKRRVDKIMAVEERFLRAAANLGNRGNQ